MGTQNNTAAQTAQRGLLSANELAAFCAQLSMILKSGISLTEGIGIMYEDITDASGKKILADIQGVLEVGGSLQSALITAGCFPKYLLDMVEIGETTGRLDDVLDSLCAYYEREQSISRSIRSAVVYPLVMIMMMVLVIGVLVVKVMPIFNEVFTSLGSEMTGFSYSVLQFGQNLGRYSFVIVGIVVAIVLIAILLRVTTGGKAALRRFRASFFATKNLYAKIASGRFASAMALMLASGLDTDEAIDMVYRLVDNPVVHRKIEHCKMLLAEGSTFAQAVVQADIFTGIHARMITVGFRTGSLDTVMQNLAERYEEDIDAQIGGIISILEPTLVAILSVIVGMILLSVMLPLMGIMTTIG